MDRTICDPQDTISRRDMCCFLRFSHCLCWSRSNYERLGGQQIHIVKQPVRRTSPFARIEDAIAAIRAGQMIIVVDDEDRENEGDLTIAAERITPEAINFMAHYGRGLICLATTPERLDALEIPLMVSQTTSRFDTAFCVSIEAKERTTTGISPRIVQPQCLPR
jgi:hypothetical protein